MAPRASLRAAAALAAAALAAASSAPNFVYFLVDDMDVMMDSMLALPKTTALLGARGMTFPFTQAAVPVCCPSRSSAHTGLLQHNTAVWANSVQTNCSSLEWQANIEPFNIAARLKAGTGGS
jgi:arylsulfatase A-like enzyme